MKRIDWPLVGVIALIGTFVLGIIGFIGAGVAYTVASYNHDVTHHACVVTDKDRTSDSKGNSDMRIYTENCGVFAVQDAIWIGHNNSADTFNAIKVGGTYDLETLGFRVPALSDFPNIIKATPVSG